MPISVHSKQKLVVHSKKEVAVEGVRITLVEDAHGVRATAENRLLTLLKRFRSEGGITFIETIRGATSTGEPRYSTQCGERVIDEVNAEEFVAVQS